MRIWLLLLALLMPVTTQSHLPATGPAAVELYELARHVTWIKIGALILNAAVVAYMCHALWVSREKARTG